jgi:putative flippase GtrA
MPALGDVVVAARNGMRGIYREVAKFGVVGALAFVVDQGGYNLLVFGLPGSGGGPMQGSPVAASVVATGAATVLSWAGNRYWTYRHQRRANMAHELALFVVVNVIGIVITASTVFLSREVLGLDSVLSDNVARLLGWGLATVFRFFTYRRYVFVRTDEPARLSPEA